MKIVQRLPLTRVQISLNDTGENNRRVLLNPNAKHNLSVPNTVSKKLNGFET